MASVITDSNGRRRIAFAGPSGKRQQIRLGAVDKRTAQRVQLKIESLVSAIATGMEPDDATRAWVVKLPDDLHRKLVKAGLVPARQVCNLGEFMTEFLASRSHCAANTLRNIRQAQQWFFRQFDSSQPLRSVTKTDVDRFQTFLGNAGCNPNYANTVLRKMKQAFKYAQDRELITVNPFGHLVTPIRSNPERMEFVKAEWTQPILDACPDVEWKVIFAMAR